MEGQISRQVLIFLGGMAKSKKRFLGTGKLHSIVVSGSQECPVG